MQTEFVCEGQDGTESYKGKDNWFGQGTQTDSSCVLATILLSSTSAVWCAVRRRPAFHLLAQFHVDLRRSLDATSHLILRLHVAVERPPVDLLGG